MKTVFLPIALLLTLTVNAQEMTEADPSLVTELMEYCSGIAEDDGTDGMTMDAYLLNCINEELASENHKPITELPKS